jgi:hypothetical protein
MGNVRPPAGRKLLIASVGVATVSYVALSTSCSSSSNPAGNLVAPPSDAADEFPVANLVAPPFDAAEEFPVANLVAPPLDAFVPPADARGDVTADGPRDAPGDAVSDQSTIDDFPVANLVAPPIDAHGN